METFSTRVGPVELTINSIDSLIATVPYLLGFVPTRSVICLWTINKKICLTMRVDLPVTELEIDISEWARQMLGHGTHCGGIDLHIVIFDDCATFVSPGEQPSSVRMQALVRAASVLGLQIDTLVTISDMRRFEYDCSACELLGCSGHDVTPPPSDLQRIYGLLRAPAASREEVLAEINEVPNTQIRELVAVETERYVQLCAVRRGRSGLEKWRDESIALIRREWGATASSGDPRNACTTQLARSIVALNDVRCRDAVLWVIARPGADLQRIGDFFTCVVTSAPPNLVPGPASVLAAVRWLQGDGLRAMAACQRALETTPDYTLALLIETALSAGLPPAFWLDTMRDLTYEQCRARRHLRPGQTVGQDAAMGA
jgi:hypothetical protein